MKINNSDQYESIEISLDPIKHPIAYAKRVEELIECGFSKKEAEKEAMQPTEMELYYEKGLGLMLVDTGAVESGTIYSPYTGELYDDADEIS